jgi:antitoxin CcdA
MSMHTKSKRAVNLSVDSELIDMAKNQGINLSAVLERALLVERAKRWLEENRDAIESYNHEVRSSGVWSDGWRQW